MNAPRTIAAVLFAGLLLTFATPAKAVDLSGCWSGHWISCTNGHKGPLKARLYKLDNCRYRAVFSGTYWKVFPFMYPSVLRVLSDDGQNVCLSGDRWLGPISGTFTFRASANNCCISARYAAKSDQGRFELSRD